MVWWMTFLIYAAIFVATDLLKPKPQIEGARPAGLGDFQFPTATEGRVIPIIWGQVMLNAPNVVWWGNFRSEERTQKVATGLFSSSDVVIGFKYYVGMQMALCMGPVDRLVNIRINDRDTFVSSNGSGAAGVYAEVLMGGEDDGGGFVGSGWFYQGNTTDVVDTYLDAQIIGDVPAYRGLCHYVWRGGYVGTSVNIPNWAFELLRQPDGLNLEAYDPGSEAPNTYDANIMNVIYEIMTNTDWGLGISPSDIDTSDFQEAGSTLASEDNGWSLIVDNEMDATAMLKELERQADGLLYFNRAAGQWRMSLARDDYDVGTLETYDEANIIKLHNYARTTWEETVNEVRLEYQDRADNYKKKFAFAQDSANAIIQGSAVSVTVRYPGVKVAALANRLAWENLRTLSYPLAKIEFEMTRVGFSLVPGTVFKFNWTRLGITGMVFRVSKLDYGDMENGRIHVWAVQDIFALGAGTFADPPPTAWVEPMDPYEVVDTDEVLLLEAPRQMVYQDPWNSSSLFRVWMGSRHPGGNVTRLQCYQKNDTSRPIAGSFGTDISINRFLLITTLKTSIPDYYATAVRPAAQNIVLNNEDPDDVSELAVVGTASDVTSLLNIIYMDGEYIGFESASMSGSDLVLTNLHRGLFHTAPKAHTDGVDVWFIGQGGGLDEIGLASNNDEIDIQLRSKNRYDESTEGETPTKEISMDRLWRVPNAPRDPVLNSVYAPSTASLDTSYTAETGLTGDDARALEIEITPRHWRIGSVIDDANLELAALPYLQDNPRMEFTVTLDPDGTPAALDTITIDDSETPTAYALRNDMITAVGSNTAMPTDAKLAVVAKHDPPDFIGAAYFENPVPMEFAFDVTSGLQSDDLSFGGFIVNVASDGVVFGEAGTYNFDIHTALPSSGIVEINIDGGGWATLIVASASTGGATIAIGESIQLRFTQAPADDLFFDFAGPSSETGYGVLLS